MSSGQQDIEKLLHKIDRDTQEIHFLKTTLDFEREKNAALEAKLNSKQESQAKRDHQQSKMMIHQESIVRDMGRELDSISARLKSRQEEKIDWEKRYKQLESEFSELAMFFEDQEQDMKILNDKLEEMQAKVDEKEKAGERVLELTRLYDSLKRRFKEDEQKRELADTQVSKKARRIWGHYQNLRSNLAKSQNFLKKELSRSQDVVVTFKKKKVGLHKELEQIWSENLFLKQDILVGLKHILEKMPNQSMVSIANSQEPSSHRVRKMNKWRSPPKFGFQMETAGFNGLNKATQNKNRTNNKQPQDTGSMLQGSNVSFSNNMTAQQSNSIPPQMTEMNSSRTRHTAPQTEDISAFQSIGSNNKHQRSKSVANQRKIVSPLIAVRLNKLRSQRKRSSAWLQEENMNSPPVPSSKAGQNHQNTDPAFAPKDISDRKNKFERTGSLSGTGGQEKLDNLNIILSQNHSTQEAFLGETFQQKEKVYREPDTKNMFSGEFKLTMKDMEEKIQFPESKFKNVQKGKVIEIEIKES